MTTDDVFRLHDHRGCSADSEIKERCFQCARSVTYTFVNHVPGSQYRPENPIRTHHISLSFLVISYVYYKQPIFELTQEWLRELSFSRLECGVHDRGSIFLPPAWDSLLPMT